MSTVTIHAAKTNLSKLIARVEAGEEIVIARGKTPVARLTPIRPRSTARRFGAQGRRKRRPGVLPAVERGGIEGMGIASRPLLRAALESKANTPY
jgi:prevent-host-death family protein